VTRTFDRIFAASVAALAMLVPLTLVAITLLILIDSWPALTTFGLSYFTTTEWDPVKLVFGAAAYVYGTLVTTIIAVLLAAPVAIGAVRGAETAVGEVRFVLFGGDAHAAFSRALGGETSG